MSIKSKTIIVIITILSSAPLLLLEAIHMDLHCSELDESGYFLLLASGDQFLKQGMVKKAIIEYEKAIDENSKLAYAYLSLGYLYQYEMKNNPKAIQIYLEGLQVSPNDYPMNLNIMYAYFNEEELEKGINQYITLSNLRSEEKTFSFPREVINILTADMEDKEIINFCNKYLSINPSDNMLREKLAGIYKGRQEYGKAKKQLEAIQRSTTQVSAYILFDLGTCHYNLGNPHAALEYFKKAKDSGARVPEEIFTKIEDEMDTKVTGTKENKSTITGP